MSPVVHKSQLAPAYGPRDAPRTFLQSPRSGRLAFSMRTRMRIPLAYGVAGLAGMAVLATAGQAAAAACDALTNPVYISGSSASQPILQALANALAAGGSTISIIYQNPDSCLGVADLLAGTASTETA